MDGEDDIFGEDYFPVDPDEEIMQPVPIEEVEMDLEPPAPPTPVKIVEIEEPQPPAEPEVTSETPPLCEETLVEDVTPSTVPPDDSAVFYPVSSDNDRVYLRQRQPAQLESVNSENRCFLDRPLSELHAMALELTAKRNEELSQWMAVKTEAVDEEHHFFVDKYKPKSFVDLLSDDGVNRQTLCWLGEWKRNMLNPFHGVTISAPPPQDQTAMDQGPVGSRKILLIGGPPGVGKSALIDVCCKHFKFQVVESGAADDRTRTAMQKLITDVCESRSVLDASRPQILVIEEVDADECPAADILADLMRRHPEKLKRPVICVCNDVYKKTLKSLRECSTVIQMTAPKALRLSEKVKSICQKENIKIESLAIDRLVAICDRDIRSTLNQLQTLIYRIGRKLDSEEPVRVADILRYAGSSEGRSADAAVKDNQRTELELMQILFEPKRSRSKNYRDLVNVAINNAKSLPIGDVLAHCFVTIPYTDVNMRHACELGALLSLTDIGVMSRCFILPMRYASYWCPSVGKPRIDLGAARRLFASRHAKRIDRETVTAALVKSSLHCVRSSRCMMQSQAAWTLYFSRLVLLILSPEHNPVWTKKTSKHVHPEIERIAKLYADFGIELTEDNSSNSELQIQNSVRRHVYLMNPNMRLLSELDDGRESVIEQFPVGSHMGDLLHVQVKLFLAKCMAGEAGDVQLIAKGKRSIAPAVDVDDLPDAFKKQRTGAPMSLASWRVKPTGSDGETKSSGLLVKKHDFEFRFNEGHTNAVKRTLKLRDFLPQRARE